MCVNYDVAALAALDVETDLLAGVAELVERRARVYAGLTAAGWTVPKPHGNFVWFAAGDETAAVAAAAAVHLRRRALEAK